MQFGQIDIPQPLVDASLRGELVLFVGAGASMCGPTPLPGFVDLTRDIARQHGVTWDEGEAPEVYLGQLKRSGFDVASVARALLSDPKIGPSHMHRALIDLYRESDAISIVTTNMDLMLETVLTEREWAPPIYDAPAVPLGRETSGLVYLHGSASNRPGDVVLTDDEFARAYITDGWARRFLVDLFAHRTVLFVGYSNSDVVVRYLQRGMPPNAAGTRYALCRSDQARDFRHLGITPISLGLERPESEQYEAQLDSVRRWSRLVQRSHDEHVDQLKSVLCAHPPGEGEDADFIQMAVQHPELVEKFCRHAKQSDWVAWLSEHGLLDILRDVTESSHMGRALAGWLAAGRGVAEDRLLDLLAQWDWRMSRELWWRIAWNCAYAEERPCRWARLVDVLLRARGARSDFSTLFYAIENSCPERDTDTAKAVLVAATEIVSRASPRIVLADSAEAGPRMEAEPELRARGSGLRRLWTRYFRENLETFGSWALALAVARIREVYLHLRTWGLADEGWDRFSMVRSTIEPSEQNHEHWSPTILVDVAHDCVAWVAESDPRRVLDMSNDWIRSEELLLRRLAVHARLRSSADPDASLAWVLAHNLIYADGLKHEVFALLEGSWQAAGPALRSSLLARIDQVPYADCASSDEREIGEYERFNALQWLLRLTPADDRISRRIEHIKQEHPDWSVRERLDLDYYTSSAAGVSTSPLPAADLKSRTPDSVASILRRVPEFVADAAAESGQFLTPTGLLMEFAVAAAGSPEWGFSVAEALLAEAEQPVEAWDALVSAWARTSLSDQELGRISDLTRGLQVLGQCRSLGDLMARIARESTPRPERASSARSITHQGWITRTRETPTGAQTDWLFRAINSPGGKLAQAWIDWGVKSRSLASGESPFDPSVYREVLDELTEEEDLQARLARTVLASRIHHARWIDEDWALTRIPPYFDWGRDPLMAHAAWDGFLQWGKWDDDILARLALPFTTVFPHVAQLSEAGRRRLAGYVAGIFLLGSPEHHEQVVTAFVRESGIEDRTHFAREVADVAAAQSRSESNAMWSERASPYWERRLTGAPRQLVQEETFWMSLWGGAFPAHADEVSALLTRGPIPRGRDGTVLWRLKESGLAAVAPRALASIALQLLRAGQVPYAPLAEATLLVDQLHDASPADVDLRPLDAEVRRLGGG